MSTFIELEYTGKIKENNTIFDTTSKIIAEKAGIFNKHQPYGPITICLSQGHLLAGLEKQMEGKEFQKEFTIDLAPEDAFGKKDAKELKIIPLSVFQKDKVDPKAGLQINVDGKIGVIRSTEGGRIIVDFNHPLAGKDVTYTFKKLREVHDSIEQIKAILKMELHLTDVGVHISEKNVALRTHHALPDYIQKYLTEHITKLIEGIEAISYTSPDKASEQ